MKLEEKTGIIGALGHSNHDWNRTENNFAFVCSRCKAEASDDDRISVLFNICRASKFKPETKSSLDRYVENRVPTGDFLRAVLENNLKETFRRADPRNRQDLFEIVQYVYNELPQACWGSPTKVDAWLDEKE